MRRHPTSYVILHLYCGSSVVHHQTKKLNLKRGWRCSWRSAALSCQRFMYATAPPTWPALCLPTWCIVPPHSVIMADWLVALLQRPASEIHQLSDGWILASHGSKLQALCGGNNRGLQPSSRHLHAISCCPLWHQLPTSGYNEGDIDYITLI